MAHGRWRGRIAHHVVGPGDEVGSPLDVGDGALALMNKRCLPAIQPVPFIQKQLREGKKEEKNNTLLDA